MGPLNRDLDLMEAEMEEDAELDLMEAEMEEDAELDLEEEEDEVEGEEAKDQLDLEEEEEEEDLEINVLFHDNVTVIMTDVKSSNTAEQLMGHIRDFVKPPKAHSQRYLLPLEIKEGAMFIFQGKDLCELVSHTLKDLGMVGRADIFIVYPGLLLGGCDKSMSSKMLALVESARTATQTGIAVEEFLDKSKESCYMKNIFVEVPLSDGMDLVIPVMVNFKDEVDCLKWAIRRSVLSASELDVNVDSLKVEEFDLFLDGVKLDPKSIISSYDVKENCNLKLSRKCNVVAVSAHLPSNRPMLNQVVKMELTDSVGKVKARVHQVTGTPPEWQLLRYQNTVLCEEYKSLADLGIRFSLRDYFPWAPENGALDLLPCVSLVPLEKLEVEESGAVKCHQVGAAESGAFKYRRVAVDPWKFKNDVLEIPPLLR